MQVRLRNEQQGSARLQVSKHSHRDKLAQQGVWKAFRRNRMLPVHQADLLQPSDDTLRGNHSWRKKLATQCCSPFCMHANMITATHGRQAKQAKHSKAKAKQKQSKAKQSTIGINMVLIGVPRSSNNPTQWSACLWLTKTKRSSSKAARVLAGPRMWC